MIRLNFRSGSAFASKKAKKYLNNISTTDIKSIMVIRHAAIGDFMNIRPFLIKLKEYFPNVKITLNVESNSMYGIPYDLIDNIIVSKKHDLKTNKKISFLERIANANKLPPQDIIFDLTDSSFSLLLVFFSKAKLKIGYSYRWIRRIFYDISILRSDFVVESENILHMLYILGAKKTNKLTYGFKTKYPKKIKKQIVYFAGASVKIKCWENEKFIKLINKLSLEYKEYSHIILQGIKEDEKFLDIYNKTKYNSNVVLQNSMELDKTMQFLSNSVCVISNDTGIRNMAIAVDTPTVGIFFNTGPFRYWPCDDKHICIFNNRYESPNVDEVYYGAIKILNALIDSDDF